MSPAKKQFLFAVSAILVLLTGCASTPAATPDPEFLQIEQTVEALVSAENKPPVQGRAPGAAQTPSPPVIHVVVQEVQAADTPTPTLNPLQQLVNVLSTTQSAVDTSLAEQAANATATALAEEDELFATPIQEPFDPCKIRILSKSSGVETFRLHPRIELLDLHKGDRIFILQSVNLRSGPTLTHRILLTLHRDPSTTLYDRLETPQPPPTVTPRAEITYTIIGGPAYTTIGDETGDNVRFSVSGRKYKWWQIELPSKMTGWIVEASACGQIQFIAKADQKPVSP